MRLKSILKAAALSAALALLSGVAAAGGLMGLMNGS